MGEAKRRKKLDVSFGKSSSKSSSKSSGKSSSKSSGKSSSESFVSIKKSDISNNWLIIINGQCFDSAIDYEDAQKVAQWAENELKKHPLPKQCSDLQFAKWVDKYGHYSPDVKAQIQQFNRETGKVETIVFSPSDLK